MLERRSALATAAPYASHVLQMGEVRGFSLFQVAGSDKAIGGKLPKKTVAAAKRLAVH